MGSHESNLVPANALSLRSMQKAESRPGFPNLHPRWARVGFPQFIAESNESLSTHHVTMFRKLEASPYACVVRGTFAMGIVGSCSQGSQRNLRNDGISGYPKFIRVLEVSTILLRFGKLQHFLLEDRLP